MWRDVLLGARRAVTRPAFAIFATLAIALGAGVPAAVYGAVRVLLLAPVDLPAPGRLAVLVAGNSTGQGWRQALPYEIYLELHEALSLNALPAATLPEKVALSVAGSTPTAVSVEAVTGRYFELVGEPAEAGRVLTLDDEEHASPVIVLSKRLAARLFQSPRAALGQVVSIGETPFQVVGVAPDRIETARIGHQLGTDGWIPISTHLMAAERLGAGSRPDVGQDRVTVLLRLARTNDIGTLNSRLGSVASAAFLASHGASAPSSVTAVGLQESLRRERGFAVPFGLLFMILVSLILFVAVGSVANLMLSRFCTAAARVCHSSGARRVELATDSVTAWVKLC